MFISKKEKVYNGSAAIAKKDRIPVMNIKNTETSIKKATALFQSYGFRSVLWKVYKKSTHHIRIAKYDKWIKKNGEGNNNLDHSKNIIIQEKPLVSILVPVYNTPPGYLHELVSSVLAQTYENYELILADGKSTREDTKNQLIAEQKRDPRIIYCPLKQNTGISGNTNEAFQYSKGKYIVFCDHDDVIASDALYEVICAFQNKKADFVYTDEDRIDENSSVYSDPNFKPDFSLDLLFAQNYICHLSAVKREIYEKLNGLNSEFDGSQDHDFNLRVAENGYNIVHIPKVLYHWRIFRQSTSNSNMEKCRDRGVACVQAYFNRNGIAATVTKQQPTGYRVSYAIIGNPLVSIVISKMDFPDRSKKIREETEYENIEFVADWRNAKGKYLAFLGEDITPDYKEWLVEMLMHVQFPTVVAAGGLILDRRNNIRHMGMVFEDGILERLYYNYPASEKGLVNRFTCTNNFSAVDPDFCMLRRSDLNDHASECKSDNLILFFLKMRENSRRIVFTPYSLAHRNRINEKNIREHYDVPFRDDPYINRNMKSSGCYFS